MAGPQSLPHETVRPALPCARCQGPLKTVHNRTRCGLACMQCGPAGRSEWRHEREPHGMSRLPFGVQQALAAVALVLPLWVLFGR